MSDLGCLDSLLANLREDICCRICKQSYCDERKPRMPRCGHDLCDFCLQQMITKTKSNRKCDVCQEVVSPDSPVNYALLAISQRLQAHTKQMISTCFECKETEKEERIKLCLTCAEKAGFSEMSSWQELLPFVCCAYCIGENHADHKNVKFQRIKIRNTIENALAENIAKVVTKQEKCATEAKNVEEEFHRWFEQLNTVVRTFGATLSLSFEETESLVASFTSEADKLVAAAEVLRLDVQSFQQKCQASTLPLRQLIDPEQTELPEPGLPASAEAEEVDLKSMIYYKNENLNDLVVTGEYDKVLRKEDISPILEEIKYTVDEDGSLIIGPHLMSSCSIVGKPGKEERRLMVKFFKYEKDDAIFDKTGAEGSTFVDDVVNEDEHNKQLVKTYMMENKMRLPNNVNQLIKNLIAATRVTSGSFIIWCYESTPLLAEVFATLAKSLNNGHLDTCETVYIDYTTYLDQRTPPRIKVFALDRPANLSKAIYQALRADKFKDPDCPIQLEYKFDVVRLLHLRQLNEDVRGPDFNKKIDKAEVELCGSRDNYERFLKQIDFFMSKS